MKKIIVSLFFISVLIIPKFSTSSVENSFYVDDRHYKAQATSWIRKYILDYDGNLLVYPKEVQIIANLIYFSYKRSYATLEAQEIALKSLDTIWKGWQNIAQTRLDPSKDCPYYISQCEQQNPLENFWHIHDEHRKIGKTYSHAIDNIVHGDFLFTINAKNSVDNMRIQARGIVAQSIVDIRRYIGQLFYSEKKSSKTDKKGLEFINYLWSYLPKLALNSFVEANNTNDMVSEESWEIIMKIQQVGKQTWQMIEQERAAFYLAFYKEIWNVIDRIGLESEYTKILFNENGPISIDRQHDYLP